MIHSPDNENLVLAIGQSIWIVRLDRDLNKLVFRGNGTLDEQLTEDMTTLFTVNVPGFGHSNDLIVGSIRASVD